MSPIATNRVALVVDRGCGGLIRRLVQECPVWVVGSAVNNEHVPAARRLEGASLTVFHDVPELEPSELAVEELNAVREHHPAAIEIRIVGALATAPLVAELASIGFSVVRSEPGVVVAALNSEAGRNDH